MAKYRLAIIEDDETLASTLKYNLEAEGYAVFCAADAARAEALLLKEAFDLVVMDVNLPDGDGFELCRMYRRSHDAPVVFLTANDMEADTLRGYELGADDYVTKPFSLRVFMKKIDALLRRTSPPREITYSDGLLRVDFTGMSAECGGEQIKLTPLEFRMLKTLIQNKGIVLTRRALLEKLWDAEDNFVDEHALTAGMSRLRGKIERGGRKYIKTIYGMGYMWMGEGDE